MQPEAESDSVERLVEVFQGDAWSGGNSSAAEIIDMYRVTCLARECPALPVDESAIQAVRSTIASLSSRWHAVPVGGAMQLEM
jgi:nitric oxide synthase oxygenase domain/subunit